MAVAVGEDVDVLLAQFDLHPFEQARQRLAGEVVEPQQAELARGDMDFHQIGMPVVAVEDSRAADVDPQQRRKLLDQTGVQLQRLAFLQPAEAALRRVPAGSSEGVRVGDLEQQAPRGGLGGGVVAKERARVCTGAEKWWRARAVNCHAACQPSDAPSPQPSLTRRKGVPLSLSPVSSLPSGTRAWPATR